MTDLGTLGGNYSVAVGISNLGQVVGFSTVGPGYPSVHGFLWTKSGGMVDVGTLGGTYTKPVAVNLFGQVVGHGDLPSGETHAFSWTKSGGIVDLGPGTVVDVSDLGVVVGNGPNGAFAWTRSGGMVNLGDFTAVAVNAWGQVVGYDKNGAVRWTKDDGVVNLGDGMAVAVNNFGQVFGWSIRYPNANVFSWSQSRGRIDYAVEVPGHWVGPITTSNAGQVVGYLGFEPNENHYFAFSWTKAGGLVNLGTLQPGSCQYAPGWSTPCGFSWATGVNLLGQVVGVSTFSGTGFHAFSWTQAGGMVDLGSVDIWENAGPLLGPGQGDVMVNDLGQIVSTTWISNGVITDPWQGDIHAVLWDMR